MNNRPNGMAGHNLNIVNSVIRQFGNGEEIYPRQVWLLRHTTGIVLQIESDEELSDTLEEMADTLAMQEACRRTGLTSENWNAEYENLIGKVNAEKDRILAIAKERA